MVKHYSVRKTESVNELSDVTVASPSTGQVLTWSGSAWVNQNASGGVTDHGALTGLSDDDHTQYHTDTRGDARYPLKTDLADPSTSGKGGSLVGWIATGLNAVSRTVKQKLGDHPPTPQDYGAVGDGVTDDTTAFERWLVAIGGKEGHIPAGVYIISRELVADAIGTKITGAGIPAFATRGPSGTSGTILRASTSSGIGLMRSVLRVSGNYPTLRDFCIDGNSRARAGLILHNAARGQVDRVAATYCLDIGINLDNAIWAFLAQVGTANAGAVDAGGHYWAITATVSGTEQFLGSVNGGVTTGVSVPTASEVNLSRLPIGPSGTTKRTLYRTVANASFSSSNFKKIADINDNTTRTYTDATPDASLGATNPTTIVDGNNNSCNLIKCVTTGNGPSSVARSTAYSANAIRGYNFRLYTSSAGTTDASLPGTLGTTTLGQTVTDGTVTWTDIGDYLGIGAGSREFQADNNVVQFWNHTSTLNAHHGIQSKSEMQFWGAHVEGNEGYAFQMGEAADIGFTEGSHIMLAHMEANTLGGIRYDKATRCLFMRAIAGGQGVDQVNSLTPNAYVQAYPNSTPGFEITTSNDDRKVEILPNNAEIAIKGFAATSRDMILTPKGTGSVSFKRRITPVTTLTDGATVTPDASLGELFKLSAGGSRTIATPTNTVTGQQITIDILNNTGGAITTTWNATYKLAGAWVDPAATKRRTITFYRDGTNWVETHRSQADI